MAEKSLLGFWFSFIGDCLNFVSLERLLNIRLALRGVTLGTHIVEGLMLLGWMLVSLFTDKVFFDGC